MSGQASTLGVLEPPAAFALAKLRDLSYPLVMMIDPDVATVLERLPALAARYEQLALACDGDPGAAVVFEELGAYVSELAEEMVDPNPSLRAALAAVEAVAATSDDAEELVVWSFLDTLSPAEIRRLRPLFGPTTIRLLGQLGTV